MLGEDIPQTKLLSVRFTRRTLHQKQRLLFTAQVMRFSEIGGRQLTQLTIKTIEYPLHDGTSLALGSRFL